MFTGAQHFLRNECGATAIEYGLICALLVVGVAVVLPTVGTTLNGLYQKVSDAFGHG
jgi:Flp pilus assembly pilin Flp